MLALAPLPGIALLSLSGVLSGKQLDATYLVINYSFKKAGGGHLFLFDFVNASLKAQSIQYRISYPNKNRIFLSFYSPGQPHPASLGGGSGGGNCALF